MPHPSFYPTPQLHHRHQAPTTAHSRDKPDPAAARSSGKTPVRSSTAPVWREHRAQHGPASRERLAARPHATVPGNVAGLGFRKADKAREAASLQHAPTGARGDAGGGVHPGALRPGASPGSSLTPGASGKARQALPPASPHGATCLRV